MEPGAARFRGGLQQGHVVESVPQEFGGDGDAAEAGAHDDDPRRAAAPLGAVFLTIS
ncbi:hypothetical protein [Streptomyces sp. MAI_2237]